MRALLLRAALFLSPFAAALALEVLVLPPDAFTFRCWEALTATEFPWLWRGPFYPGRRLEKTEQGDIGKRSEFAVKKRVVWEIDRFGFRKRPSPAVESPDIVLIGDSNLVGSGLTQDDTLAAVLERRLGRSVYPYAPADIGTFLADPRFWENPPKVVVLVFSEGSASISSSYDRSPPAPPKPAWKAGLKDRHRRCAAGSPLCRELLIRVARLRQRFFVRFVRARALEGLDRAGAALIGAPIPRDFDIASDGSMLFSRWSLPEEKEYLERIPEAVRRAKELQTYLKVRGMRMVLAPIPDKRTIHYRLFPGDPRRLKGLPTLMTSLRRGGVRAADLFSAFKRQRDSRAGPLYLSDDSHWSPDGVRVAAEAIARRLELLQRDGLRPQKS